MSSNFLTDLQTKKQHPKTNHNWEGSNKFEIEPRITVQLSQFTEGKKLLRLPDCTALQGTASALPSHLQKTIPEVLRKGAHAV